MKKFPKPNKGCIHNSNHRMAVGNYTNNGGIIYCATVCLDCGTILFVDEVIEER